MKVICSCDSFIWEQFMVSVDKVIPTYKIVVQGNPAAIANICVNHFNCTRTEYPLHPFLKGEQKYEKAIVNGSTQNTCFLS